MGGEALWRRCNVLIWVVMSHALDEILPAPLAQPHLTCSVIHPLAFVPWLLSRTHSVPPSQQTPHKFTSPSVPLLHTITLPITTKAVLDTFLWFITINIYTHNPLTLWHRPASFSFHILSFPFTIVSYNLLYFRIYAVRSDHSSCNSSHTPNLTGWIHMHSFRF